MASVTPEVQRLARRLKEKRASQDSLLLWEPTSKQRPFIESVLEAQHWENWFIAANRSGKTDAGAFCGAMLARQGVDPIHPSVGQTTTVYDRATSGWVACVNFRTLWETVEPKYFDNKMSSPGSSHKPFIPPWEIEQWRASDRVLKLKNGSIIGFRSYEAGRESFASAGKDWIHFDEEPPKGIYNESVIRVEAGRRLRVFGTCTLLPPEGVVGGVSWLFPEVIQPFQRGQYAIGVFGSSIYDNSHIPIEEIERLESKYPEGSPERRIRLGGEWIPGIGGARAYANFSYPVHVRELGDVRSFVPLCWCLDFNVAPFCTLVGQYIDDRFNVFRELIMEDGGHIDGMVELFREAYPTHRNEIWIYGDASGSARSHRNDSGRSDYQIILNAMRNYPTPVRLHTPKVNPLVSDRVNAVNAALRDFKGQSIIDIDPSCVELIADLEEVLKDPNGGIKKTTRPEDPYSRRTHTSDGLGYWIHRVKPVTTNIPQPSAQQFATPTGNVLARR